MAQVRKLRVRSFIVAIGEWVVGERARGGS